jgi:hypothetical protein
MELLLKLNRSTAAASHCVLCCAVLCCAVLCCAVLSACTALFPAPGMENPCLTFVTPTLLSGDRSLTNVVAHEIAHSWTGERRGGGRG